SIVHIAIRSEISSFDERMQAVTADVAWLKPQWSRWDLHRLFYKQMGSIKKEWEDDEFSRPEWSTQAIVQGKNFQQRANPLLYEPTLPKEV
ncbi:MAG: hypothetical protein ACK55L_02635, partial [bacterium]